MYRTLYRLKIGLLTSDAYDVLFVAFVSFLYLTALLYAYAANNPGPCIIDSSFMAKWI